MKSIPSDTKNCSTLLVCSTGYYKNGSVCMLCPKNQIKSFSGDTDNCTFCSGESQVNNAEHTACGEDQLLNTFIFKNIRLSFISVKYMIVE